MGMIMSFMGKGVPSAQMFSLLTGKLYQQFIEKDVQDFDSFHSAILDLFNIVNSALPGKHYDVPSRKKIEECFTKWQKLNEAERKNEFVKFIEEKVNLSKLDNYTLLAGVVTPPAAMAAKKAGENVPQIRFIKFIPDVIFVPSIAVLALISAKVSRKIIQGQAENSAH